MRSILTLLLGVGFGALSLHAAEKPNILFIMADDLGWMDLRCQGNKAVRTPHLDRLAEDGMRFTDAYAASPVCSPTRAATITGLSPARLHLTNHAPDRERFTPKNPTLLPAPMENQLTLNYVTFAERLKEAGYATAFLGKWHLNGGGDGDPALAPDKQGFDINLGGCAYGGPPTFFDPYRIPTLKDRKKGEYLPDRLADETIAFMEKNRTKPFLACLWSYTVHWPMEAPEAYLKKYKDHQGPGLNDYRYGAMIEAMDASYGKIFKALDDLALSKNTLVVFTSDNGGFSGVSDCRPLRMSKGHLYEGGIRVPFIARWPGVIKPGQLSHEPMKVLGRQHVTFVELQTVVTET
ncbi:MAG: sulfatase, partial [Verrucomicrobiota bacterium]